MQPDNGRPSHPQASCGPDHALSHGEDDLALVRRWFQHLQLHVQAVDFVGARALFAEEIVTFGTVRAFTVGREATEREQWRNVWRRNDGLRWQLDDLRVLTSRATAGRRWAWRYSTRSATPRMARLMTGP